MQRTFRKRSAWVVLEYRGREWERSRALAACRAYCDEADVEVLAFEGRIGRGSGSMWHDALEVEVALPLGSMSPSATEDVDYLAGELARRLADAVPGSSARVILSSREKDRVRVFRGGSNPATPEPTKPTSDVCSDSRKHFETIRDQLVKRVAPEANAREAMFRAQHRSCNACLWTCVGDGMRCIGCDPCLPGGDGSRFVPRPEGVDDESRLSWHQLTSALADRESLLRAALIKACARIESLNSRLVDTSRTPPRPPQPAVLPELRRAISGKTGGE